MPDRRRWIPPVSLGIVYAGGFVALELGSVLKTPEYEHATDLHLGLLGLGWCLLAIAGLVTVYRFLGTFHLLPWQLRRATVVVIIPVFLGLAIVFPFSIWNLNNYWAGIDAYDKAVQGCGGPPVLAWKGYWGEYLLPSDSDYDRLKYAGSDSLINGPLIYYCTEAEAQAAGIHHLGFP